MCSFLCVLKLSWRNQPAAPEMNHNLKKGYHECGPHSCEIPWWNLFVYIYSYIYIPGTQITLILSGKGLLLEGSRPKIEDKQVPGTYYISGFNIPLVWYEV